MSLPFSTKNPYRFPELSVSSASGSASVSDIAFYTNQFVPSTTPPNYGSGFLPTTYGLNVDTFSTLSSFTCKGEGSASIGFGIADQYLNTDTSSLYFGSSSDVYDFYQIANDGTYFYIVGGRTGSSSRGVVAKYNASGISLEKLLGTGTGSTARDIYQCVVTGGNLIAFGRHAPTTAKYGFLKLDTATLASLSERASTTSHNCLGMCTDGTSVYAAVSATGNGIVRLNISTMAITSYKTLTIGGNAATCTGVTTDGTSIFVTGTAGGSGFIAKLTSDLGTVSAAYTGTVGTDAVLSYANSTIFACSSNVIRAFDTSCVYQKTITSSGGATLNPENSSSRVSKIFADNDYIYVPSGQTGVCGNGIARIRYSLSGVYTSDVYASETLTWSTADSFSSSSGTTANGTDIWTTTSMYGTVASGSGIIAADGLSLPTSFS